MGEERSAFVRGPKQRPLRIVIDRETALEDDALALVLALAGRKNLEVAGTADDEGVSRIEIDPIDTTEDIAPYRIWRDDAETHSGVWFAHQYARMARESARTGTATEEEALRALLLAACALDVGADALITGSAVLLSGQHGDFIARSNPMEADKALALAGLYLRLRGDYPRSPWLFYWVVARDLLHEGWRWASACHRQESQDDLFDLAGSAIARMSRILRARDWMHEQVRLPATNETEDVALFHFDAVMLMATAAFDVVARVAHRVYQLPAEDFRHASWQRVSWREKQLAVADENLAALMRPETPERDALDLAATLRNRIHEQALRGVASQRRGRPAETLIELSGDDVARLLPPATRLGGEELWGFRSAGGRVYLDASMYVEALVPAIAAALNALMAATKVERLNPGVDVTSGPRDKDPWDEFTRRRFRLLAGV